MSDPLVRRPRLSLTALAALLALATGGTSLLFTLRPELAPDPRTQIGASIKSVAIDTNVNRKQFFERYELDADARRGLEDAYFKDYLGGNPPKAEIVAARASGLLRNTPGSVVYVDAQGQGLKHRNVALAWYAYDGLTRQRQSGGTSNVADFEAPDDHFVVPTFIDRLPACRRPIYVRLELRDDSGTLLAIGTTKSFRSCPHRQGGGR
jgi:hypothetical protein